MKLIYLLAFLVVVLAVACQSRITDREDRRGKSMNRFGKNKPGKPDKTGKSDKRDNPDKSDKSSRRKGGRKRACSDDEDCKKNECCLSDEGAPAGQEGFCKPLARNGKSRNVCQIGHSRMAGHVHHDVCPCHEKFKCTADDPDDIIDDFGLCKEKRGRNDMV